jgi:hypothetical protein
MNFTTEPKHDVFKFDQLPKLVREKRKKPAKVFGIPSEAEWKKGSLPLASTQ